VNRLIKLIKIVRFNNLVLSGGSKRRLFRLKVYFEHFLVTLVSMRRRRAFFMSQRTCVSQFHIFNFFFLRVLSNRR